MSQLKVREFETECDIDAVLNNYINTQGELKVLFLGDIAIRLDEVVFIRFQSFDSRNTRIELFIDLKNGSSYYLKIECISDEARHKFRNFIKKLLEYKNG